MDIEGNCLNIIEAINDIFTENIILKGEKLKVFPLRLGTRQDCPLWSLLFNVILNVLAITIRKEKLIKGIQMEKKK